MPVPYIPNDVLLTILEHVPQRDLTSVSLLNQQFHFLTEPILYSTFTQISQRKVPTFLRTIIERPELARHFKNLRAVDGNIDDRFIAGPFRHDYFNIRDFGRKSQQYTLRRYMPDQILGSKFCDDWYSLLCVRIGTRGPYLPTWDSVIALLLVMLPSLETIEFGRYSWKARYGQLDDDEAFLSHALNYMRIGDDKAKTLYGYPYIHAILHAATTHHSLLSRLRRISLSGYTTPTNYVDTMDVDHFRLYLRIPSITSLHGLYVTGNFESVEINKNITKVTLIDSDLDANSLRNFLSSFHNLKVLHYAHNNSHINPLVDNVMCDGLMNSKNSLEVFKLATNAECPAQEPFYRSLLGSIGDFFSLKVLDIEIFALIGWPQNGYSEHQLQVFKSAIPERIEDLTLRGCTKDVNDCLDAWLLQMKFPSRLKSVKVSCRFTMFLLSPIFLSCLYTDGLQLVCRDDLPVEIYSIAQTLDWEIIALRHGVNITRETVPHRPLLRRWRKVNRDYIF